MVSFVAAATAALVTLLSIYSINGLRVLPTTMILGDLIKKTGLGGKDTSLVNVEFLPSKTIVQAKKGDALAAVAEKAGVEIKFKCKKGECGTCEVNMNGKWVKACQTTVPSLSAGDTAVTITVKEIIKAPEKAPSKFFSPKSFVEGVVNNGLGVVGFVKVALEADDEFTARMKKEAILAEKVAAAKKAKQEGRS